MPRHTTHRLLDNERLEANKKIVEILRTVPYEKGFHFYTAPGNFTGETATSLDAFEKKLQVVPPDSVNFHLQRGDFQKWIEDTLGDGELARRVSSIKLMLPVEDLRKELLAIVQTRITEFRRELPHHLRHTHS
jgi:alpha-amylase